MKLPVISVVIACYNGERFLSQQLESVIAQTYSNLEIIISDDNSTDATWEIIEQFAKKDSRIKAYRNKINLGYIKNFERSITTCTGEYVAFCDQDDIWHKEKLFIQMKAIQNHSLCYCDSEFIDEQNHNFNKKLSDIKNLRSYTTCLPFVLGNCISGHATLIKTKRLLQSLPFPAFIPYDWYLAFFCSCTGNIKYIDQPLVQYRQHQNNSIGGLKIKNRMSKRKSKKRESLSARDRMRLFSEIADKFSTPGRNVIQHLNKSYQSFSIKNNFKRAKILFQNRQELLAIKKRSSFRKWLFCIKMFFKIT